MKNNIFVAIFLSAILAPALSNSTGVYQNFDAFPVTGESEIPADGNGWIYSSGTTNTGHDWSGSCGYWDSESGTKTTSDIHNYFHLYINGGNNPSSGFATFEFFDIDDQVSVYGNSFKITVTGGVYGDGVTNTNYGLELYNKEDYLTLLDDGQDPIYTGGLRGAPYMYFNNSNITGAYDVIPLAAGSNRLSFYIKVPDSIDNDAGDHIDDTFGTGPYSYLPNPTVYPEGHSSYDPDGTVTGHYYHDFYTRGGGWTHIVMDTHPQHNNGFNTAELYPYPSNSMRSLTPAYYDNLFRFYFAWYPYSGIDVPKYNVYLDEIEFIYDSEPQNEETINNISILMKQDKSFEIGFNDKYKPNSGGANATYEVRYSFSQITNTNWDSAISVHMLGDDRWSEIHENTDGLMRKVSSYRVPVWAPFRLATTDDENLLTAGTTIYFAVKDVSQSEADDLDPRAVGWGRDYRNNGDMFDYAGDTSAMELIKRVDYYVSGVAAGPIRSNGGPTGEQSSGTTSVTLTVTTEEPSTCTYGADGVTGVSYPLANSMADNSNVHTATVSGLVDGGSYSRAIRCSKDSGSEANDTDYTVSWTVASAAVSSGSQAMLGGSSEARFGGNSQMIFH